MTTGNIDKLKQIFMEVFSISETEVESYIVGGVKQDISKDTFKDFKL